jgi:hypothetical protein
LFQDSDDEDVEQEIDAQIEQLLSAKRTVRNIDAASAANVIGEYLEQCTNYTESMPRLSSSCQPSALSETSMPHPLPMLLVSISNSAQITLNQCPD